MENYLICIVLIILFVIGIISTVKHFKGKGGCCGGSEYKPKKKKLSKVLYKKEFTVQGMHCNHCKNAIEEAVNSIKNVAGIVNFKKGILTVSYADEVSDEIIIQKLEKLGYKIS